MEKNFSGFTAHPVTERVVTATELQAAPGATLGERRTVASDGALTVLLTGGGRRGDRTAWLVAGTVTPAVLQDAADELVRLDRVDRDGPR